MARLPRPPQALLMDIDGVLHVGREPIAGAIEALAELRELAGGLRLLTNTTSKSRRTVVESLREIGFELAEGEVLTPAALAAEHCRERGYRRVALFVSDSLREDLGGLDEAAPDEVADAVVLGDLGAGWDAASLNAAFRGLMDGAALIALQHNRYWRAEDGLRLDVGAYAAALEYASGAEPTVLGKPSRRFFEAALADLGGVDPARAAMVGDDVEADVGGGLDAGIPSVLVRTGKYREEAVSRSGVEPTATIGSVADLPGLLGG